MLKKIFKLLFITIFFLALAELGFHLNTSLNSNSEIEKFKSDNIKSNEYTMLILGDSVSSGYPKILESMLTNKFQKKVNVYSFAQPYARNIDLVNSLNRGVHDKTPDLVVLMVGAEINSFFETLDKGPPMISKFFIGRFILKYTEDLKLKWWQLSKKEEFKKLIGSDEVYYDLLIQDRNYNYYLSNEQLLQLQERLLNSDGSRELKNEINFLINNYINNVTLAESYLKEVKSNNKLKLLGYLKERKGEYLEAQKIFTQLYHEQSLFCLDLARVNVLMKSFAQASIVLEQCKNKLTNLDDKVKVLNAMAQVEMGAGHNHLAKKHIEDALSYLKILNKKNWETSFVYSNLLLLESKNDSSLDYLIEALEENPNNLNILKIFFDATLYRTQNKEKFIGILNKVATRSIHQDEIIKFINFYLSPLIDDENESINVRSKFLKSLLVGDHQSVNNAFLAIEGDYHTKLNTAEVQRVKNFYSNVKKLNTKLILMQIPNQRIEVLRNELGDAKDVVYLDTYSYFKKLIIEKKYNTTDLFLNDGKHLTKKGDEEISRLLISELEKILK